MAAARREEASAVAVKSSGDRWVLNRRAVLREEADGGLLYHFGSRRLASLRDAATFRVVNGFSTAVTFDDAISGAGVPPEEAPRLRKTLAQLAGTDFLVRAGEASSTRTSRKTARAGGQGPSAVRSTSQKASSLARFEQGLSAPICLTWELTYACNLNCVHCLSSSGRRDPRELSTQECEAVIDELQRMGVFYINIGGGEPTVRPDFWHLIDYSVSHNVGVKFSTNGILLDKNRARQLAASDYVDVQVSLDGATAEVNDRIRGKGSYATAIRALENLADAGFQNAKLSVVVTRENVGQLDDLKRIADRYGATLRLTRLRPAGRGADVWDQLHLLPDQQRGLYEWLLEAGENVLTGDSFFHLSALGKRLPGMNLCGAGRVVCLIDPVGDVYACPFAVHPTFLAGNLRDHGGLAEIWTQSTTFKQLRTPQETGVCGSCQAFDVCRGGCMAAKFFTGRPLDAPDPECALGHGESPASGLAGPRPASDDSHSRRPRELRTLLPISPVNRIATACDPNPLAGLELGAVV